MVALKERNHIDAAKPALKETHEERLVRNAKTIDLSKCTEITEMSDEQLIAFLSAKH